MSDSEFNSDSSYELIENVLSGDEDSEWEDSDVDEDPSGSEDSTRTMPRRAFAGTSSSGPAMSTPIAGTLAQKRAIRMKKSQAKRQSTLAAKKAAEKADEKAKRKHIFDSILDYLHENDLRLWHLLEYVFNPANKQGQVRYEDFFKRKKNAPQMLDWWMSANHRGHRGKDEIHSWILNYVAGIVSREARTVTRRKVLQTMGRQIDAEMVKSFDLDHLQTKLDTMLAPTAMYLLRAFATGKGVLKHTDKRKERTNKVITTAALLCLGEYSHSNNLAKRMLALYLYASGAQRQCISVLSTLGLSESYTNLTSKNIKRARKKKQVDENPFIEEQPDMPVELAQRTGTLHQLSDSLRTRAREIAATGLFAVVYDNININFKNPEQIIGRHDSQENGTCATLIPLFGAKPEDLDLKAFQTAFLNAPPLELADILLSREEQISFRNNLVHTILRIIIKHGGEGFKKFEDDLEKYEPATAEKIPVHQTKVHPLPSWNIDESSITGNAEVDQAIVKELRLDTLPEAGDRVRFLAGDQLSIARLRALEFIRAGQEEGYEGFFWGAWIPGLFHAKIADAHGTLLNHFGKSSGAQNPGSLLFHNTLLDRLPITLTSLPTFRTCRDLIFVSLYARVLHCLLLVSGYRSLEEYALKVSNWDVLLKHATQIYRDYARSVVVDELRQKRAESVQGKPEGTKATQGDAVFENGVLFLRDALISREFNDAIKVGDSGRVLLVLKTWALSFRGNGRTKYAFEMLHLIHNLSKVWPKNLAKLVLKNWMVNTSGLPGRFSEVDLLQEHLNFKIKVSYKARGSNASWDWMETISPCVDAISDLQKTLNDALGGDQGMRHAPPDLRADIESLMTSLDEHNVYKVQQGRVLDDDETVKDVISIGLHNLTAGQKSPLSEFNATFRRLQTRRKMNPVSLSALEGSAPAPSSPIQPSVQSAANSPTQPSPAEVEPNDEVEVEDLDEAPKGEIEQILEDAANGVVEETLPRLSPEDVALDMDEVLVEDDEVIESEDAESDEDEEDSEWTEEEAEL